VVVVVPIGQIRPLVVAMVMTSDELVWQLQISIFLRFLGELMKKGEERIKASRSYLCFAGL